jgi:hypothetical protein
MYIMPRARVSYGTLTSQNQGGGVKKQGVPSSSGRPANLMRWVMIKSYRSDVNVGGGSGGGSGGCIIVTIEGFIDNDLGRLLIFFPQDGSPAQASSIDNTWSVFDSNGTTRLASVVSNTTADIYRLITVDTAIPGDDFSRTFVFKSSSC